MNTDLKSYPFIRVIQVQKAAAQSAVAVLLNSLRPGGINAMMHAMDWHPCAHAEGLMSALPKMYSPQEYLALERKSSYKSEYWDGEIFAMAGASERHNLISLNVGAELRTQLRGRNCRVYPSDMRVRIPATGLYTYPAIIVVCGKPQFEDREQDTLLNPTLIVEVLSASTENYDRGRKFQNYRSLASLTEYLLIAQDEVHLEHYLRRPDQQWLLTETQDRQGTLHLPTIECTLAVAEVYDKVEIEPMHYLREIDLRAR
jgi:Uma2 family endonuclease